MSRINRTIDANVDQEQKDMYALLLQFKAYKPTIRQFLELQNMTKRLQQPTEQNPHNIIDRKSPSSGETNDI